MVLTGSQQAELQDALVSAYPSRFAVEQFLRYELEQNLNLLAGDVALPEVLFRVIDWAQQEGKLRLLIERACADKPGNTALQAFAKELAEQADDPVEDAKERPERGETAARGLETLEQLMRSPDVREAVAGFESDFRAAAVQIEVLAFYKDLHDLLHTLQFQCYRGITQEAKRFPGDDTSREILIDHELTLDGLVRRLDEVAVRRRDTDVPVGWIPDLREAHGEFQVAIRDADAKRLTRAIWLMDRVLAVQPSQINTRLNAAARALRLTRLVTALTLLRDRFQASRLEPAKVQAFADSIASLTALQDNVTALVTEHDRWQALDLDLRRIQQNLKSDVVELELSWDRVAIMLAPLCAADESWAAALRATCETVTASIVEHDESRERQAFHRLYAQCADRFYRVDTALKRVCESLRTVAEPLTTLLALIR